MLAAAVSWAITLPTFALPAAKSTNSMVAVRPSFARASRAAVSERPFTFGITTGAGPLETKIVIGVPASTNVPCAGSVRITMPFATVALAYCVTVTTNLYGSAVKKVCAAAVVCPTTTFGTAN